MAKRHLSAKQIKAGFGGKRRKAAMRSRPKKRHNAAHHRKRSAPRKHHRKRTNAAPRHHKKRAVAHRTHHRKKSTSSHRHRARKKNPELVSFLLGNPGRKRSKKGMARHYKRKKHAASRSNAGRRHHKKHVTHHRRRSHNPSMMGAVGNPKTWLYSGAGALAGFVGSAAIPQLLMPTSNTGITGYALSLGAAVGLGFLSHMVLPRLPIVTVSVVAGGVANLLRRIITDQTSFGSYLNAPAAAGGMGMGDYMVANWGPPRMAAGLHSAMAEVAGLPWAYGRTSDLGGGVTTSSGISTQDMVDIRSSRPC